MEAVHGTDYLIDYYALLFVPRDADEGEIKRAYHERQRQYHPDRYQGLAEEIQRLAAEKSRLFAEAYATLSNRERRQEYDRRLAGWTGPLSADGTPIIDLARPHFRAETLVAVADAIPQLEHRSKMARRFINPGTLLILLFLGSAGFLALPSDWKAMWMFYALAAGVFFNVIWSLVCEIRS